jgi:hypothetical protein
MRLFLALLLGAFLLAALAPKPRQTASSSGLLLAEPWLLRALSGFGHTLAGDWVWLKSSRVDETALGEAADAETVRRVAQAQVILDPHFTTPVLYAATYLASIPKKPDDAVTLLSFSQSLNPDRFDLLFSEAMIRVSYGVPSSGDRLADLATRIEPLPEKTKLLGPMKVDDWLLETLAYVRTKEGRAELIEADLELLLKQTTHPARRERIAGELRRIRSQKATPQSGSVPL